MRLKIKELHAFVVSIEIQKHVWFSDAKFSKTIFEGNEANKCTKFSDRNGETNLI